MGSVKHEEVAIYAVNQRIPNVLELLRCIGSIRKKEVNAMTCDEVFYRQYLSGDDAGLEALMKKYGEPLTLYIDGYLHDVHEAEEVIQTEERNRILHFCMSEMNPDYREVLYLTYFEGMSYAQAAEVTGKTVKQITNMVYRGKESLRRLLEREGITNAES